MSGRGGDHEVAGMSSSNLGVEAIAINRLVLRIVESVIGVVSIYTAKRVFSCNLNYPEPSALVD